jgi:heme exporter protein CcmD
VARDAAGKGGEVAQFFDMGGYGGFVWSAWGVAVLVLGGLLVVSLLQRARARRMLGAQGLDRRRP